MLEKELHARAAVHAVVFLFDSARLAIADCRRPRLTRGGLTRARLTRVGCGGGLRELAVNSARTQESGFSTLQQTKKRHRHHEGSRVNFRAIVHFAPC